jgi:hypothetical protein
VTDSTAGQHHLGAKSLDIKALAGRIRCAYKTDIPALDGCLHLLPRRRAPLFSALHNAGFLASAARHGASMFKMRDVSPHKSVEVLQSYMRDADLLP